MAPKANPAAAKAAAAKPEAEAKAKGEPKKKARREETPESLAADARRMRYAATASALREYEVHGELEEEPDTSSEEHFRLGNPRRGFHPGRIAPTSSSGQVMRPTQADVEARRQLQHVQGEEELLAEGPSAAAP